MISIGWLGYDKTFNFDGHIVFDDNFQGEWLLHIHDYNVGQYYFNNLYLTHKKFLNTDINQVKNTIRTSFGGIKLSGGRLTFFNKLKIFGVSNLALYVQNGSAIRLIDGYIWSSNLLDINAINEENEKELSIEQNSKYTIGAVLANDCEITNITIVGFNIGMCINSANIINNYHPWAYQSTMIHGLIVAGAYNLVSNVYLDTIKNINEHIRSWNLWV